MQTNKVNVFANKGIYAIIVKGNSNDFIFKVLQNYSISGESLEDFSSYTAQGLSNCILPLFTAIRSKDVFTFLKSSILLDVSYKPAETDCEFLVVIEQMAVEYAEIFDINVFCLTR